jgi:hypothetical protein
MEALIGQVVLHAHVDVESAADVVDTVVRIEQPNEVTKAWKIHTELGHSFWATETHEDRWKVLTKKEADFFRTTQAMLSGFVFAVAKRAQELGLEQNTTIRLIRIVMGAQLRVLSESALESLQGGKKGVPEEEIKHVWQQGSTDHYCVRSICKARKREYANFGPRFSVDHGLTWDNKEPPCPSGLVA